MQRWMRNENCKRKPGRLHPSKCGWAFNTGAAQLKDDPQGHGAFYEGYATLALTQRIMSVGHGGQILLSQTTHDLVKDKLPDGNTELRDMGERRLKDIARPEHLYQVVVADLLSDFPPLTTLETSNHNLPAQLTSFIGREQRDRRSREIILIHAPFDFHRSGRDRQNKAFPSSRGGAIF